MLEQMRVNDEIWLPHQLAVKVDFRLALLKNYNVDIEQTFRDYKKFRTSSKVVGMAKCRNRNNSNHTDMQVLPAKSTLLI